MLAEPTAPPAPPKAPKAKLKLRLSIRAKLVGMINFILIAAAAAIVIFATTLFSRDNTARVQESNLDSARLLATQVKNDFSNLTEKMRLLGVTILQNLSPDALDALQRPFFESEKDFLAETVVRLSGGVAKPLGHATNDQALKAMDLTAQDVLRLHERLEISKLLAGAETIQAGQLKGNVLIFTIAIPLLTDDKGNVTHATVATIRGDRFLKAVESQGITTSYLVDGSGYLLAHPDAERVLKRESVAHLEIVKQLLSGKSNNGQTEFTDPASGEVFLGAYWTVGFGGIGVVSQVSKAKALEAAKKVKETSILITGMVAVIAFLIVFFFSLSLTQPLVRLVDATREIVRGHYDIQLKRRANDEIGDLTKAFGEMAQGLAERDRVKATFAKFHSKEMAEKVLSGELKLGGERKSAVVFFSDVRGFTAMSEKLDPEALVKILNRYMTRMVRVILDHHGIVDTYVGDAIMACWGVPLPKPGDIENAIRACIGMRQALADLNTELEAEGLPLLKIGMGLNYGPLIAGNIGSEERMEYTVIGDTVNTASRIESLTKEFGTDMLASEAVLSQVPGKFVIEKAHEAKVKGKSEPLVVYKVHGYIDENGNEVVVETPYSSYAAEKSDKVVHDDHPKSAPEAMPLEPMPVEAMALEPASGDSLLATDAMDITNSGLVLSELQAQADATPQAPPLEPPPGPAGPPPFQARGGRMPSAPPPPPKTKLTGLTATAPITPEKGENEAA